MTRVQVAVLVGATLAAIGALGAYALWLYVPPSAATPAVSLSPVASTPLPSASAPASDPFAIARALARAGFDQAAADEAKKALIAHPELPLPGDLSYLSDSSPARDPFLVTRALIAAGMRADAIDAAKEAIKAHPTATIPPEVATLLFDPFGAARSLARAGMESEARSALVDGVKADPSATVPADLRYLAGPTLEGALSVERADARVANAFAVASRALLGLVVFVFLLGLARRAWAPRFKVEKFEGLEATGGSSIAALFEEELAQLRHDGGGPHLAFVTSDDAAAAVPEVIKASARLNILGALAAIVPSNQITINGQLQAAGTMGVGLTISAAMPFGGATETVTLWEQDYDPEFAPRPGAQSPSGVHQRLAAAAAAWALYRLTDTPSHGLRRMSTNWQSYAAFRVGAIWHSGNQRDRARRLYVEALAFDPCNTGAMLNLALLDAEDHQWERAILRLETARELIEELASKDVALERMWYRTMYSLAATKFHHDLEDRANGVTDAKRLARDTQDGTDAKSRAKRLILQAFDATDRVKAAGDAELREFVQRAKLSALVLLADIWDTAKDVGSAEPKADESKAEQPTDDDIVREIQNEHHGNGGYLIAYVGADEKPRAKLSYRVRYNLACYHSQRNQPDDALRELEYGLERGTLARWARRDPALRLVRAQRADDFEALVAGYELPAKLSGLERATCVGPRLAALLEAGEPKLKRRPIKTLSDLRKAIGTEGNCESFLHDYEHVAPTHAKEIWGTLELETVLGVGEDNAILLSEARVFGASELRACDAKSLAQRLANVNKLRAVVPSSPTEAEVTGWIDAARAGAVRA